MADGFYVPLGGGRFASTDHTRGPWGPDSQHAGPPSALLGRAVEAVNERTDMRVAGIRFDILKPVPVENLQVSARLARPGRSVELVEAALTDEAGDVVMQASAWRIRIAALELPEPRREPLPAPEECPVAETFATSYQGYLQAMEWRLVAGHFVRPGPATVWVRARHPLVAGEASSPLTAVLIATDSASGVSAALDWSRWLFINPDLAIYLHRMPADEWVCLDAETMLEPHGIGMAWSVIHDRGGPIGRSLQSLFLAPR